MYPHTDCVRIGRVHPAANFKHALLGLCDKCSTYRGRFSPLLGCGICIRRIRAQPSRQSSLTLRYGRKICHRNFLNSQPVQKVQRRIKFFRFVRRLLKSVRLRSYFRGKDNACLSLPPNIFSRIYLKVVQVSQHIQLI